MTENQTDLQPTKEKQDDRKSDRFAADERKAGESPDAYSRRGTPTNARSAGIFKGL